jgi:hypothetical protein
VDWTTTRDTLQRHPGATSSDTAVVWKHTTCESHQASTTFWFRDAQQTERPTAIDVVFDDAFPSMGACKPTWAAMRAKLDARFGRSSSDNLAAYWTSPTTAITLACDPIDAGALLTLRYEPPAPD